MSEISYAREAVSTGRVFMTGAAGYVGSAVAAALHGAGHGVSGLAWSR